MSTPSPQEPLAPSYTSHHGFRFHAPHVHLNSVFGSDWFGIKAEAFARFFGTPTFLIAQTCIVAVWIGLNMAEVTHFDLYPFILLNLAFSLQAAYAESSNDPGEQMILQLSGTRYLVVFQAWAFFLPRPVDALSIKLVRCRP